MSGTARAGDGAFDAFVADAGERVRRALVAFYGVEIGTEAAADALAIAWERWAEVSAMDNPAGYLFRVGQSRARPHLRWARRAAVFPATGAVVGGGDPALVDLFAALARLRPPQRAAVLMTKSYGFTYAEVASMLGITETAVTNHVHRGLQRLRTILEDS